MSSQRLKCIDFLSNEAPSSKRVSEFMPYVHERDEQGNLISPNTQRRQLKKLTPVKKQNRGELTIRNILQITKDHDQNYEITQAARVPTDFCNQQFFIYNDWKYFNEHPAKKSKMRKLHNLLNQASQSRIPRQPSLVDYNPNYEFNKKKVIQNIIISKEIPKRTIRYKSQCMDEDSNIKREETPRQERQQLNINMKQNPYYLEMLQKMKFDQGISDISNFKRKIEQTIQKCHLSKEKILKGS